MKKTTRLFSLIGATALATTVFASPAMSVNPHSMKYTDKDLITITGDVISTAPDVFTLDYGTGSIKVEMDDWDSYDEASLMRTGEKVTVYGRIDDGLYEQKTIEANMVYAHDRNSYLYANDADEEGDYVYYNSYSYPTAVPDGTWTSVSGKVAAVSGRELQLNTGSRTVVVDTMEMAYNPLDDKGYQQIDVGDSIYVSGRIDNDFFEEKEIDASTIVTLRKGS